MNKVITKYDTDSPETKDQAEAFLKEYYKSKRPELKGRPNLLSWKLNDDGTIVLIDGTSGRKLEFVTNEVVKERLKAEEAAEDAEKAMLDAEAEALEAEAEAAQARNKAEQIKATVKATRKTAKPESKKAN